MRKTLKPIGLALTCSALLSWSAAAQSIKPTSPAMSLAEYPNGTFLENAAATLSGGLLATSYFARTLELIEPDEAARTFATMPAHPVGIVRLADGSYLVSAHGAPFTGGPAFTQTQQLIAVSAKGSVTSTWPVPEARFLNGLVLLRSGIVLAADSIAATIWAIDPKTKVVTAWLQDSALAQDATSKEFRPGANGLKISGNDLFVSNSSLGTLSKISITKDGKPAGRLAEVAKTGPIDDFWVESKGSILFTTHGAQLKRLDTKGAQIIVLADGCDGCTSVFPFRRGSQSGYAVLTTGSLLEGGKGPARVLFVPR
jgi:hypothetical protein